MRSIVRKFVRRALTFHVAELLKFKNRTRIRGVFKKRLYLLISSPTGIERSAATDSNLSPRLKTNYHLSLSL